MTKSLDESKIIAALLHDVFETHGAVFNHHSRKNTLNKVFSRLESEGVSFLTKTFPRLGKAFDKALSEDTPLNARKLRFDPQPDSQLPRFLGELFNRVLQQDGTPLQNPCITSIRDIRQLLYCFYKYELPYSETQEQQIIDRFEKTEDDLSTVSSYLRGIGEITDQIPATSRSHNSSSQALVRTARRSLSDLFAWFIPEDISPRHGPGAVATRQRLWDKYQWVNVSARITKMYPLDAFFYASLGHLCDDVERFNRITDVNLSARVVLVPKDSRGPRLISCEPVDIQWIQQGLGTSIVELVERHPLTKWNVFFTDQRPNQIGAQLGSETGRYATLDLNEASDRVTLELVRLLFPPHICEYLEACRSDSTELPDGRILNLQKFAPMGSSLCFPILALTIWSILNAAAPDQDTRESILVYGDDVIVPAAFAENAIEQLSSFGLKINRDKSCTKGSFRESCGMDAFKGFDVTPLKLRTVWSSSPSPDVYTSWIAYANSFYDRHYYRTYELIVGALHLVYGDIADDAMSCKRYPSLRLVTDEHLPKRCRTNHNLQKREWRVRVVTTPATYHVLDGWVMLLRYFAEKANPLNRAEEARRSRDPHPVDSDRQWRAAMLTTLYKTQADRGPSCLYMQDESFSVRSYTQRDVSILTYRWR